MTPIKFTVHAIPVAQPRQRHRIVQGKTGSFVSNYTAAKHPVNAFKAACQIAAQQMFHGAPLDGPLRILIVAIFPRPGNMMWKTRPMPRVYKIGKPDFDNLAKSVCDALTGITWRDDALVADARVVKMVAAGNEQPKVEVTIEPLSITIQEDNLCQLDFLINIQS